MIVPGMAPAMTEKNISEFFNERIQSLVKITHLRAKLLVQVEHLYGRSPVSVRGQKNEISSFFCRNNDSMYNLRANLCRLRCSNFENVLSHLAHGILRAIASKLFCRVGLGVSRNAEKLPKSPMVICGVDISMTRKA